MGSAVSSIRTHDGGRVPQPCAWRSYKRWCAWSRQASSRYRSRSSISIVCSTSPRRAPGPARTVSRQRILYYWQHRASHRIRWMWATHAVHHSANRFDTASVRLGWTVNLRQFPVLPAAVLVGFHPFAVVGDVGANLLYQFFIHTELAPRLGPLGWILNTPATTGSITPPTSLPRQELRRRPDHLRPPVRDLRRTPEAQSCATASSAASRPTTRSHRAGTMDRHAA